MQNALGVGTRMLPLVVVAACGARAPSAGGDDVDAGGADARAAVDATASAPFVSCAALSPTCGADGHHDCCASPRVPGGTFDRGFDVVGDTRSGSTSYPATVSDFGLDAYEVTVGRFRAFVDAGLGTRAAPPAPGSGAHPAVSGTGWDPSWDAALVLDTPALTAALDCDPMLATWTDAPGANEHKPIMCVTWYEAMAFCAWDGGRLPSEAEWNFAAAGGDQQRGYPWSSPPSSALLDPAHATYYDGNDCVGDGVAGCTEGDILDVGARPAGDGRWGQSDLAGNALEWTLDWQAQYPSPCVDCVNLTAGLHKELRGGSFGDSPGRLRTGARVSLPPTTRTPLSGFRCART